MENQSKEIVESDLGVQKKEEVWQDIWEGDTEIQKENRTKRGYWVHCLGALAVVFWALGAWFLWRNFAVFLWVWVIMGITMALIFILISLKWVMKKPNKSFLEEYKPEHNIEPEEVYTQLLNIAPNRKKYVLKNEKDTITLNEKDAYIIGRDENLADIVLRSNVVSRKHGQIRLGSNSCFLTDLCSKNGIRVNGVRLGKGEEIELLGGELIQFADTDYYFQQEN